MLVLPAVLAESDRPMTTTTECRYPDVSGTTAYGQRCRCERCRQAKREYQRAYKKSRQAIVCARCPARAELQIDKVDLCWDCLNGDDRQALLAATYTGRYGKLGSINDGRLPEGG